MKITGITRLFNPLEMVRALVRGDVQKTEATIYGVVFLVSILSSVGNGTISTFSFPGGEILMGFIGIITMILYLFVPMQIAWKKLSLKTYIKYFVSLNMPISILVTIVGILVEITFSALNGTLAVLPISIPHFFFMAVVFFGEGLLMIYCMMLAVRLQGQKIPPEPTLVYKNVSYFNPFRAVLDYRAGLISKKGILVRKIIVVVSLLSLLPPFFTPTNHPLYSMISTILFLLLYIGFPLYINMKLDNKDFFTRFSVVGAPIFIDVMFLIIFIVLLLGIIAGGQAEPAFFTDYLEIPLDIITSAFAVYLMVISFKEYNK